MFTDVKKGYKVIVFLSVQFNMKSSIVSIEIYFSSIEKYLQRIIPWNLTKMKDIGFANIVHGLPEQVRGVDIVFLHLKMKADFKTSRWKNLHKQHNALLSMWTSVLLGVYQSNTTPHLTAPYPSVNLQCLYKDYV